MEHALPMYKMMPNLVPEGMVMVIGEALSVGEMAQCIKESMECSTDPSVDLALVYPIPGHPANAAGRGFHQTGKPSSTLGIKAANCRCGRVRVE